MMIKTKQNLIGEPVPTQHKLGLLIIQPTPFCNIDCDYCYLPDRTINTKIPFSMITQLMEKLLRSGMVGDQLSIVWHAGEPLAVPISFYQEAFQAIKNSLISVKKISHSFQTNGTLINDRWCEFIKEHNIKIGVSIDGPDFIHDVHRKDRLGKGTHVRVMEGVECLRRNEIDFHVIAVITEHSLDYADEVFQFFLDNDIHQVGFNIEEIEGTNRCSTLSALSADLKVRKFFERMFYLQKQAKGSIRIREFDQALQAIFARSGVSGTVLPLSNSQTTPFNIISVDARGNISSFSPELLGMKSSEYGDFCFGNIATDEFAGIIETYKFKKIAHDIERGNQICSQNCQYYFLCGGGAPSNKYYENGSFSSGETMYCRNTIQIPLDIMLRELEISLNLKPIPEGQATSIRAQK
jgi:uncharacterized protein